MPVITDRPALNTLPNGRLAFTGAASTLISRPSRNRPSRSGASRKSSADRLGGVSTTIRSHSSDRRSWPSFSIAMYSCVPEKLEDSDW